MERWQSALNKYDPIVTLSLHLVGEALEEHGQLDIFRVLSEQITPEEFVYFDISNGIRHQPIIAAFATSLLRWTHQLQGIAMFYTAFEVRGGDSTPVIELGLCNRLMESADHAATWAITGNYSALASSISDVQDEASAAWLQESTNQLGELKATSSRLQKALDDVRENLDPLEGAMAGVLRKAAPTDADKLLDRYRRRAEASLARGDYLRAVVLIFEAITRKASLILLNTNPEHFDAVAYKKTTYTLKRKLEPKDRNLYLTLRGLRNCCVHGTRPGHWSVRDALASPDALRAAVNAGLDLYDGLPTLLR